MLRYRWRCPQWIAFRFFAGIWGVSNDTVPEATTICRDMLDSAATSPKPYNASGMHGTANVHSIRYIHKANQSLTLIKTHATNMQSSQRPPSWSPPRTEQRLVRWMVLHEPCRRLRSTSCRGSMCYFAQSRHCGPSSNMHPASGFMLHTPLCDRTVTKVETMCPCNSEIVKLSEIQASGFGNIKTRSRDVIRRRCWPTCYVLKEPVAQSCGTLKLQKDMKTLCNGSLGGCYVAGGGGGYRPLINRSPDLQIDLEELRNPWQLTCVMCGSVSESVGPCKNQAPCHFQEPHPHNACSMIADAKGMLRPCQACS